MHMQSGIQAIAQVNKIYCSLATVNQQYLIIIQLELANMRLCYVYTNHDFTMRY